MGDDEITIIGYAPCSQLNLSNSLFPLFVNKDHLNYNIAETKSIDTFTNVCSFLVCSSSFSHYEIPIRHSTAPHSLFPKNRTSNKFRLIISIPSKHALLETSTHSSNQFAHLSQAYRAPRFDNVIACIIQIHRMHSIHLPAWFHSKSGTLLVQKFTAFHAIRIHISCIFSCTAIDHIPTIFLTVFAVLMVILPLTFELAVFDHQFVFW